MKPPVGRSPLFRQALERACRVAPTDVPVLVTGESGSGKEVVARWVHALSPRADRSFVAVNATALPAELMESELFGHERGAFTGASRPRNGLFVEAHRGTLLIDEIGDLSLPLQAKLLRVLQEGEVRPVGRDRAVPVDVRVICATHRDLARLVREGRFREDLYYRVCVFDIQIPSLRERGEDVLELAAHVLASNGGTDGLAEPPWTPAAADALLRHSWPGNVRELENACRHALVLCPPGGPIDAEHLPASVSAPPGVGPVPVSLRDETLEVERQIVLEALATVGGNRTAAARRLGISRQALQDRLRRWKLGPGAGRPVRRSEGS